ncbi:MAG: rhodanese-like domain-containing protein, partial [Methanobacteriaceae archaeon]|nr:rhodanese-like domain-containing protein [Methanobacteriaceae archaeon]
MKSGTILAILVLICGIIVISGCTTNTGNNTTTNQTMDTGYQDVNPAEAKELIDTTPGIVIIDVSPKYDEGHLPGAINYPVSDGSLDKAIPTLNKNDTYLVYCHVDSVA